MGCTDNSWVAVVLLLHTVQGTDTKAQWISMSTAANLCWTLDV